jgi:hypothetical protein
MALGLGYWLAFLLALLPDNLLRAAHAGMEVSAGQEAIRIAGAALLGTLVTPAVWAMTQRFPVALTHRLWCHVAIHVAANTGLALWLVLSSCLLAAWVFEGQALPRVNEVQAQLTSNWSLLTFALIGLTALLHQLRRPPPASEPAIATMPPPTAAEPLTHISALVRGQPTEVALADVDWIETHGNYLGLHVGAAVHLVRGTLVAIEPRLDPQHFLRIHRRVVVALDRVASVQAQTNGDAVLRLDNGTELRLSRSHRQAFAARWRAAPSSSTG